MLQCTSGIDVGGRSLRSLSSSVAGADITPVCCGSQDVEDVGWHVPDAIRPRGGEDDRPGKRCAPRGPDFLIAGLDPPIGREIDLQGVRHRLLAQSASLPGRPDIHVRFARISAPGTTFVRRHEGRLAQRPSGRFPQLGHCGLY